MADYYNLLSRAVSGLPNATPDARRAIYERARKALLGQLRAMQPPVPEADIQRESDRLDEAIARLEAGREAPAQEAAAQPKPSEPARPVEPAKPAGPARPSEQAKPADAAPAAKPAPPKAESPKPEASKPEAAKPSAPVPPPAVETRPAQPKPAETKPVENRLTETKPATTKPVEPKPVEPKPVEPKPVEAKPAEVKTAPPPETQPAARMEPSPSRVEPSRPAMARPAAPSSVITPPNRAPAGGLAPILGAATPPLKPTAAPPVAGPAVKTPLSTTAPDLPPPAAAPEGEAPDFSLDGERDRPLRPLAPTPEPEKPSNLRVYIIAAVLAAVIGGMGYAAWLLRENPEDLAKARAQQDQQQQQAAVDSGGKIVERIGGGPATPPAPSQPVPTVRAPATSIRPEPAPAANAAPVAASDQPALPVAHRSAMLVEAPDEANKIKLMVGAVTWKAENGQLRAEIEVPEAQLKASMVLKKNDDQTIAASHLMEVRFSHPPDATYAIKDMATPEMRRDETPNGDRLVAAVVPVTADYYLVGLARGEREASNLDLIRSRGWFDLPLLLQNGRVAKVTFEKGVSGERAMTEASQGW